MADETTDKNSGWLDKIERLGNRLPDPVTLFVLGAVFIVVLSQIGAMGGWSVDKTVSEVVTAPDGSQSTVEKVVQVTPFGLLSADGAYWAIESLVKNFTGFAPLGIVLVGMLGIGIAERTGAIGALLKVLMLITPRKLLTPAMIAIGIFSSLAMDAGYVVLPPIAAALYKSMGRSPLVGLAAVFVGVSAGFSANIVITGLDPLLAGFTKEGANILDPAYEVATTCNYWFMIVSTVVLTFTGWAVTAWIVEPRYANNAPEDGGPVPVSAEDESAQVMTAEEKRGLTVGGITFAIFGILIFLMVDPFGSVGGTQPLEGTGAIFDRWIHAIVPLLFFVFLLPGIAYGIASKTIRRDKDVAKMMGQTMAEMGPYIVLAFFAAQFVAYFKESNLGEMLALAGGRALASADMPAWLLLAGFILLVMVANLFIGSASAKYAFFAPVFVPMFMAGGNLSPELTQAAYRVGDSCSNIITPLNPYVVIVLVFLQKYVPKGGIGTLVALMLPYALVFAVVWTILLLVWMATGFELGPQGPIWYEAIQAEALSTGTQ